MIFFKKNRNTLSILRPCGLLALAILIGGSLSSCDDGGKGFRKKLRSAARDVSKEKPINQRETKNSKKKKSKESIQNCPEVATLAGGIPPQEYAQWCQITNEKGKVLYHGEFRKWHKTGKLRQVTFYAKGQLHGTDKHWHSNGKKKSEESYLNGKKHGLQIHYGKKGDKVSEQSFARGILHGKFRFWSRGGKLKSEGFYQSGIPSGTWVEYNKDESRKSLIRYSAGKKDGISEFYSKNGILRKSIGFKDDIENGNLIEYRKDGTKSLSGSYLNGKKEGAWIKYDRDGGIKKRMNYHQGKLLKSARGKTKVKKKRGRTGSFGKGDIFSSQSGKKSNRRSGINAL